MAAVSGLSAGGLVAKVRFDGTAIESVALDLQRPMVLAGLRGRSVNDCLLLLPKLFPLCGTAHALAALQAVESASAIAPAGHAEARATLALADALAAHVWRTSIEWPQLTGAPSTATLVARARRLVGRIAISLYPDGDWQCVAGGRLAVDDAALGHSLGELRALRAQLDIASSLATMRSQQALAIAGAAADWSTFLDESFVRMAQATAESFEALDLRLQSMFDLPATSTAELSPSGSSGRGFGQIDTARGELRYEIGIDCGRIVDCSMVAPTDRVFAVDGPVARMLNRLRRADDPLRAVRWVLAAWDPCIEVRVEAV